MISKEKKIFYKKNGYLKITNFFSDKEIFLLTKYVSEIEKFLPKKGQYMMYFDNIKNQSVLTRTENFLPYHKKINNFLKKKKITKIIDSLLGQKTLIFKDKINWKYPNAKGFEPHQDAQVWDYLYPNIKSFISLAISIDKTNKKNGCLEVVGGAHKNGLLGNNKSAINKKLVRSFIWKKITTMPGDFIIFDSYTPHRSGKNLTKKSRRMIYLTYNAKKDGNLKKKYFDDKRKSFPPNNERDEKKKYKYLI